MSARKTFRILLVSACAASVCAAPLWAQQTAVTIVAPVNINASVGGAGASFLSPEELEAAARDAAREGGDARDAARECRGMGNLAQSEDRGDYSLEALYNTEAQAQLALEAAARTAQRATQNAATSRASGANSAGEDELARQSAIKAYQTAMAAATEAHLRVADLQDQMRSNPGQGPAGLRGYVDAKSQERTRNGGVPGVYTPDEFKDLGLTNITAQQIDAGGVAALHITGTISNPRRGAINVPPLWFTALDRYGTMLKSEQTTPTAAGRIPARGSQTFSYDLKPMPEQATKAVVTFAPESRPPMYLPAEMFCGPGAAAAPSTIAELKGNGGAQSRGTGGAGAGRTFSPGARGGRGGAAAPGRAGGGQTVRPPAGGAGRAGGGAGRAGGGGGGRIGGVGRGR